RILNASTGYPDLLMSVHELQQSPDSTWPHFGVGVEQEDEAGRIGRSERRPDSHIVTRAEPSVAGCDLESNPTLPAMGSNRLGQRRAVARSVIDHGDADPSHAADLMLQRAQARCGQRSSLVVDNHHQEPVISRPDG